MTASDFELKQVLEGCSSAAISGHVRPDGDCVGACLGLMLYLKEYYPQIETAVYLEPFSDTFRFLEGADQVRHTAPLSTLRYDILFVLDCADAGRLGDNQILLDAAGRTVCIDHHITNKGIAQYNYIRPNASSTCELICDLTGTECLTKPMAEALYMGMVHDTGVFQYSCTSRHTMEIAGALMEKEIAFSRIVEETFFEKTYRQKQILGRALLESMRLLDGQVIFTALRQKDLKFYCVDTTDLDGIVQTLKSTKGVEAAIFLYETGPQQWKISMRSTEKVDVAAIAAQFGGGGHMRAAGANMQGSVYDVVNNLTERIEKQLRQVK